MDTFLDEYWVRLAAHGMTVMAVLIMAFLLVGMFRAIFFPEQPLHFTLEYEQREKPSRPPRPAKLRRRVAMAVVLMVLALAAAVANAFAAAAS